MTRYEWWGAVPDHLVTKTTLAALDMPRCADGVPVAAHVTDRSMRGNPTFALFDMTQCPPTSATGRQLAAARATSDRTRYRCADCGAHTERPVPGVGIGAGLCPACRHITRLRAEEARLAAELELIAADVAAVLDGPDAVVVQVDQHVPPPADSGRARPATAVRVRVAGLDGRRLADVTVRLVGPRARWVPEHAVDPAAGWAKLGKVLDGKRLVAWSALELDQLHDVAPAYPSAYAAIAWAAPYRSQDEDDDPERTARQQEWLTDERRDPARPVLLAPAVARWRGVLDPATGKLVDPLPPGTPDRTALLMATMAGRTFDPSHVPTMATAGRKAES